MIQKRLGIFETNSSSTHNISIKFKKQKTSYDKLVIEGDICFVYGINQGDFYPTVYGERDKLDYLLTWMYLRDGDDISTKNIDYSLVYPPTQGLMSLKTGDYTEEYENILKAIQSKYPEVKRIYFKDSNNAYFDHQTSPYEEDFPIDLEDQGDIYNYLFNDHLIIELGHD